MLNGNSPFCPSLLPFPFFPVLSPKNRAKLMVLLASKLMKYLCCVSISDLTKVEKKKKKRVNRGEEGKRISAFEDVSSTCMSHG